MFVHGSVQKREMLTRRIRIDRRLIHHLLDGARIVRRSAGVVDDPIVRAFARDARFTEKDHDVKRILLDPRLMKKNRSPGFACLRSRPTKSTLYSLSVCASGGESFLCH